jgi:hypothetical protein
MSIIIFQNELRPVLPTVFGSRLEEMDHILTATGIEHRVITQKIITMNKNLSVKRQQNLYWRLRQALRYCILLGITEHSYRDLSLRVADSHLFQWFTYSESVGVIRPLSKSAIERFEKLFTSEEITNLIHDLNRSAGDKRTVEKILYRETELRFDEVFADTTCVKANIHFPVDWVLFREHS